MKKQNCNIIFNKKASYNFFIEETFEAGIVLLGWEVKSLRSKKVNITNSYISFKSKEAYLVGMNIDPISSESNFNILNESNRIRKILLKKNEILYLCNKLLKNRLSVIVLSIFFKKNWCKIKIGLAKGKNLKDKREHKKCIEWKKTRSKFLRTFHT
ncbi:MAG: SsrA-binding protein SmpB [Buchnera aphidicola (Chaetogeoica yunlongensis)]